MARPAYIASEQEQRASRPAAHLEPGNETSAGIPPPFFNYSLRDARKDAEALKLSTEAEQASKFYHGDHWQYGAGWIGPYPAAAEEHGGLVMGAIERGFVSENKVKEVIDRHAGGVVGREANWYLVPDRDLEEDEEPTDQERALIKRAEALLTAWWDKRGITGVLQDFVRNRLLTGRGVLRVFIPNGKAVDGRLPAAGTDRALRRYVWVEAPSPAQAGVISNPDTKDELSLYTWQQDNKFYAEVSFLASPLDEEESSTVVRVLGADGTGEIEMLSETEVELGGRLMMFEAKGAPLATPQVLQNQKLLNLALTMLKENVIYGGYLERVITNGQIPGTWKEEGGKRRFVPDGWGIGYGVTSFLQSTVITDAEGNKTALPASVSYRDPVAVDTFKHTRDIAKATILEETKQMFVEMNADGAASGTSRKQARYDFLTSLLTTKPEVDEAIRWLLSTALEMEGFFSSGAPLSGLRVVSDIKADAGPLTDEERKEIVADYTAGLISRQTAMMLLGVDDVDAEALKISEEMRSAPKPLKELALVGYAIDQEQFPELDEQQGFKKRSEQELRQRRLDGEEMRRMAAEAEIRARSPESEPDDEEVVEE